MFGPKPLRPEVLLRIADSVRAEHLGGRRPIRLADAYTIAWFVGRKLHRRFPDVRIMVGDCQADRGPVEHHWLEIPSREMYLDPTRDEFDPTQPVRIGRTTDPQYACDYRNAQFSGFQLDEARDDPKYVYAARTAWSLERP